MNAISKLLVVYKKVMVEKLYKQASDRIGGIAKKHFGGLPVNTGRDLTQEGCLSENN